jgi:hypothetical protein
MTTLEKIKTAAVALAVFGLILYSNTIVDLITIAL